MLWKRSDLDPGERHLPHPTSTCLHYMTRQRRGRRQAASSLPLHIVKALLLLLLLSPPHPMAASGFHLSATLASPPSPPPSSTSRFPKRAPQPITTNHDHGNDQQHPPPHDDDGGRPPVVWTIAGSDSGGGAGIQADLHAFHAFGCHGCSVITALTAQNSREVRCVQVTPLPHLRHTMEALDDDLPPKAIKIGMLATPEVAEEVGLYLAAYEGKGAVVCDPVMVSTSGARLLDEKARSVLLDRVLPHATLVTPNRHEAELLVGYPLTSPEDYERAAKDLLHIARCKAVLIKGGHSGDISSSGQHQGKDDGGTSTTTATGGGDGGGGDDGGVVQDYLLDGRRTGGGGGGMWLSGPKLPSANTHGTGCTLSSAIAALLAQGHPLQDAVVLAKAYVSQGIRESVQLGKGPGPVRQTAWPDTPLDFPWVTDTAALGSTSPPPSSSSSSSSSRPGPFPPTCGGGMGLYPCVDTSAWVFRLAELGVKDIQLRVKDKPLDVLDSEVRVASEACRRFGARLWVNDYWDLAIRHQAYGLHIGQEDMTDMTDKSPDGGPSKLDQVRQAGIRLGVSSHNFEELGRALALRPSYISLGPIFHTTTKDVKHPPQGYTRIRQWRQLLPRGTPLVVIGGITTTQQASKAMEAGADSVCVVSAITKATAPLQEAVRTWQQLWATTPPPQPQKD